jgi:hypothetical protein
MHMVSLPISIFTYPHTVSALTHTYRDLASLVHISSIVDNEYPNLISTDLRVHEENIAEQELIASN